jgi:hypothetical protein
MDRDKLMKMASAVRTGGKGTVRRLITHAMSGAMLMQPHWQLADRVTQTLA